MTQMPTPYKAKSTSTAHAPITLRKLRLWHWRKAMAASKRRQFYEARGAKIDAKKQDQAFGFHIKCVQALNDVVSGTAENDDA